MRFVLPYEGAKFREQSSDIVNFLQIYLYVSFMITVFLSLDTLIPANRRRGKRDRLVSAGSGVPETEGDADIASEYECVAARTAAKYSNKSVFALF